MLSPVAHARPGRPSPFPEAQLPAGALEGGAPAGVGMPHVDQAQHAVMAVDGPEGPHVPAEPCANRGQHPVHPFAQRGGLREPLLHDVAQLQLVLGAPLRRDVQHHPGQQGRPPCLVLDHAGLVAKPHHAPVARDQPVLRVERLAGCVAALLGGERLVAVLGVHAGEPQARVGHPFIDGIAERRLDPRADVEPAPVRPVLGRVDDRRQAPEQIAVPGLGLRAPLRRRGGPRST